MSDLDDALNGEGTNYHIQVICAWCKIVVKPGRHSEERAVSHTICRSCVNNVRREANLPALTDTEYEDFTRSQCRKKESK